MPVVPFSPAPPKREPVGPIELPTDAEPWVLMAAATMDSEGRLLAQPAEEDTEPNG